VWKEMDDNSGRPWVIGDGLIEVAPPGQAGAHNSERTVRVAVIAEEVGCTPRHLNRLGETAGAWAPGHRRPGVAWSVFEVLRGEENRFEVVDALIQEYGEAKVTKGLARKAMNHERRTADDLAKVQHAIKIVRSLEGSPDERTELALQQLILAAQVLLDRGQGLRAVN
jgi:hypothetical protein